MVKDNLSNHGTLVKKGEEKKGCIFYRNAKRYKRILFMYYIFSLIALFIK